MRLGESKRERYQPNLVPVSELQPSDVGCCRCRKKTIIEGKDCYVTDPGCPEIILFLLVLGLVMFILAALNVPAPPRFNLMAGGLAAWILAEIIVHWPVR
jgi:hypothetical protein